MTDDQMLEDAVDVGQVSAVSPAQRPTATRVVDVMAPGPRPADRPSFVYALGRIEPRFPSLSVEKEFAQAVARTETAGLNDRQTFRAAISERQNRYLARSLCWLLVIESLETYVLLPRDPADLDLLIDSYREDPRRDDLDVVIGLRGRIAPPEMCNGLAVPIVVFDQVYSFDRDALVGSIPRPTSIPQKGDAQFRASAGQLFDHLTQLADNAGATDEHRALNYLTVRYPQIYAMITEMHERNVSFHRCAGGAVLVDRSAFDRRRDLQFPRPNHGRGGEALRARRRHRAAPIPGQQVESLLRPIGHTTGRGAPMSSDPQPNPPTGSIRRGPRQVRLPGFISEDAVGLGDVIKRATALAGIKPCGGCARRAEALNRRVQFTSRQTHRSHL